MNFTAEQILTQFSPLSYESDYVELLAENPFTNPIFLQITWNAHRLEWYKTTWRKHELAYTLQHEVGEAKLQGWLPIAKMIDGLHLPCLLDCSVAGRDGHFFQLKRGDQFAQLAYQWYEVMVPDGWEVLNEIASRLLVFGKSLLPKTREIYQITYQEEENNGTKMSLRSEKLIFSEKI